MTRAMTTTTISTPIHTPASKIPIIRSQLLSVSSMANNDAIWIFFIRLFSICLVKPCQPENMKGIFAKTVVFCYITLCIAF